MSAESSLTAVAVVRALLNEDTDGLAVLLPDGQALGVLVEQGPDDGHGGQAGFSGHWLPSGW